jgi:TonB family protein
MPQAWKEWEGRVVNKEFRLGEYQGGSENAGVFLTQYGPESLKAAVKLIPIGNWNQQTAEAELTRLEAARELPHPHLLRIFQVGRTTLDDAELLFIVMEYADENLSQFLPKRALKADEVREMLKPTLDALDYLHSKGSLHGDLKPSNVLAIGDQLKLSSDGVSRIGVRRWLPGGLSEFEAPELGQGESLAASDTWSLAMLLVMTLTQQLPERDAGGEPVVADLPAPYGDIARHCLKRDPGSRWGLAEIAGRLGLTLSISETEVAKAEERQTPVVSRAAAGPQPVPQKKTFAGPHDFPHKRRRPNPGAYIAAAAVLLVVGILVGPKLFRSGIVNSQTDSTSQEQPTAASAPSTAANSEVAQVADKGASSEAASRGKLQPIEKKTEAAAPARVSASRRGVTSGQVAQQVLPDVPRSALDTIHGTVRVGVRISVDTAGNVTDAELDSAGPSKYFAHLALEAAQQWKFAPPKVEGRNVLSDWFLRFQFTGQGTKVIPVQSDP